MHNVSNIFLNVSILKEPVFLELYADDLDHTHMDFVRKVALENNRYALLKIKLACTFNVVSDVSYYENLIAKKEEINPSRLV